jgi:hypothetical protein
MKQIRRIAGGFIDRKTPLSFEFNGRRFEGYQGDTLASALIANGQTLWLNCAKVPFKSRIPGPPLSSYSTSSARKAKIIVAL